MKLLAVTVENKRYISCIVDMDGQYQTIAVKSDNDIEIKHTISKSKYRNYETYALIMGKFNPYTFFSLTPVTLKDLSFKELKRASKVLYK